MEDNVTEKRMENKMTDPLQTFKESAREIATELHDTGGHYLLTDKQFDALTAAAQAYGDARVEAALILVDAEMQDELAKVRKGKEFTDEFMEGYESAHRDSQLIIEELLATLAGSTTGKEDTKSDTQ